MLDLTGLAFSEGIGFAFPEGVLLEPGAFAILVADAGFFGDRYPRVDPGLVVGIYSGNLSNAGETLTLGNGSRGFEVRARLRDGQDHEREQLIAVATLDPVTFDVDAVTDEELVPGFERTSAVTALNRWLLRIPVDRRVEALWEYEITSR